MFVPTNNDTGKKWTSTEVNDSYFEIGMDYCKVSTNCSNRVNIQLCSDCIFNSFVYKQEIVSSLENYETKFKLNALGL